MSGQLSRPSGFPKKWSPDNNEETRNFPKPFTSSSPTTFSKPRSSFLNNARVSNENGTPSWAQRKQQAEKGDQTDELTRNCSVSANTSKPSWEKPAPATSKPSWEKPAPATSKPSWEKPAPATSKPSWEKPAPATSKPSWEKPAPATSKPSWEKPAPATSKPSWAKPTPASNEGNKPSWAKPTPASNEGNKPSWAKPTPATNDGGRPSWAKSTAAATNEIALSSWKRPDTEKEPIAPFRNKKFSKLGSSGGLDKENNTSTWNSRNQKADDELPPSKQRNELSSIETQRPSWKKPNPSEEEPPWKRKETMQEMPSTPWKKEYKPVANNVQSKYLLSQSTDENDNLKSGFSSGGSVKSRNSWSNDSASEKDIDETSNSIKSKRPSWSDRNLTSASTVSNTLNKQENAVKPFANKLSNQRDAFLHKPSVPPVKPNEELPPTSGVPRLRSLPSHVYNSLPPPKPQKPPNVQLPGRAPLPNNMSPLPPPKGNSTPQRSSSFLSKNMVSTSPSTKRRLPPAPAPALPPSRETRGSSTASDDLYTDTALPPPPPLKKMMSAEEIPTWDDEDEFEELYDDTTNEPGDQIPPIGEDGGDMYEDLEEYMKLKKAKAQQMQQLPEAPLSKEEEKKKKDAEKKDKEIRKKFKLPKEGEIPVQSGGFVKLDAKGGGKDLTVRQHEKIEIIRMNDNPKSKWLVRNSEGAYGYIDSSNVDVATDNLRQTMESAKHNSFLNPPLPPPMRTQSVENEEDPVYDQTPDEDLYEEFN